MENTRHDEDEVYEASRTGSVESLNRLIQGDRDILWRISLHTGKTGTPLHVSALHGHAEFTKALYTNNRKLAERVDADGRTPLHLASAEGHKETVEALLSVYADACLRSDEKGRIPLHYAAMRGEVEVLQKLIDKNSESIYVKVQNRSKETVLHLCIIHNQLECLKRLVLLVERDGNGEFLNSRAGSDGGVTIMHLALMLGQIKTIRYLISFKAIKAEAIDGNGMSLTMLDIFEFSSVAREDFSRSLEIQQILIDEGLIRRATNENDNPRRVKEKKKGFWRKLMISLRDPHEWAKETRNSLMIVATVISAMTFQAAINPPNPVWDNNHTKTTFGSRTVFFGKLGPRTVRRENNDKNTYSGNGNGPVVDIFTAFRVCNTISFLASLTVTLLLMSRFPPHNKWCTWLLSISMRVTLVFLALTYIFVLSLTDPYDDILVSWSMFDICIILWIALLVIGGGLHTIRFLIWVMKRLRPMNFRLKRGPKNMPTTDSPSCDESKSIEVINVRPVA